MGTSKSRGRNSDDADDDVAPVLIFGWERKYIILAVLVICLELIVVIVFAIMLAMKNSDDQNNNKNNEIPTTTTAAPNNTMKFFPDPATPNTSPTSAPTTNVTIPCWEDPDCQIIMDGLAPIIPPANYTTDFVIPATCQERAREFLNYTMMEQEDLDEMRTSQLYALAVFYCEMNGDHWKERGNWLSHTVHECEWYNNEAENEDGGASPSSTCDMEGRLTSLRLPNNALSGTLPPELSRLSFLTDLDLSNNPRIYGTIPREYDTIVNLKSLQLSSTFYDSSPWLPPYLFRMFPRLQRLELANNGFTGILPADLPAYMPQLTHLNLANNSLSFEIPSNFGELNLHQLHLQANDLTGTIPPELFQPPNLEGLYLHDNILSGTIPIDASTIDSIMNQKNLTEGTFYNNHLLEGIISEDICDRLYLKEDEFFHIHVDCARVSCFCCWCT